MGEIAFEHAAVEWAESQGWLVRKMTYPNRRGCPDRFFFKAGIVRIIELKKPGEEPSIQQAREHARYKKHGHRVHVVSDMNALQAVLAYPL